MLQDRLSSQDEQEIDDLSDAMTVLALDLNTLKCVTAEAVNFSDWGCKLVGDGLSVLKRNIAIKLDGEDEFQRARITGHKNGYVTLVFLHENPEKFEKRAEKRHPVTAVARVSDLSQSFELKCMITDASRSGCRLEGEGLDKVPDSVLVFVEGFEKPVRGQVAWRQERSAGLMLFWDGVRLVR